MPLLIYQPLHSYSPVCYDASLCNEQDTRNVTLCHAHLDVPTAMHVFEPRTSPTQHIPRSQEWNSAFPLSVGTSHIKLHGIMYYKNETSFSSILLGLIPYKNKTVEKQVVKTCISALSTCVWQCIKCTSQDQKIPRIQA
jgi:hypothetical protein